MRHAAIAALAVTVAGSGCGLASEGTGERRGPPDDALQRAHDQLERAWMSGALDRAGIFVTVLESPSERCVPVSLLNPTKPNVEYLQHRFGSALCVDRGGGLVGCPAVFAAPVRAGRVVVPDVRGLGVYRAERRLVARGLTYAVGCRGEGKSRPKRPPRYSPQALVRVTRQCPRAGERVPPDTEVGLDASAVLPGGYRVRFGVFEDADTRAPCADGRNFKRPTTR